MTGNNRPMRGYATTVSCTRPDHIATYVFMRSSAADITVLNWPERRTNHCLD